MSAGRAGPGRGVPPAPPAPQCLYVCAPLPEKEPGPQPAGQEEGGRRGGRGGGGRPASPDGERGAPGCGGLGRCGGTTPVPFGVEAGLARVGLGRARPRPRVRPGGSPAVGRGTVRGGGGPAAAQVSQSLVPDRRLLPPPSSGE